MSFHEFNPFSGRLKQSTGTQPLYPVSPRPLQSAEIPVMIYDSIKTKPLGVKALTRQENYSTIRPKILALQKKYQANMSTPSFLLGGRKDKILFGITVALTVVTTGLNIYYLRQLK